MTAHKHLYNGTCCGAEYAAGVGGEGSTLSEGNLTIICTAIAAAVLGLGGFLLGRKKKNPAPADGTDE